MPRWALLGVLRRNKAGGPGGSNSEPLGFAKLRKAVMDGHCVMPPRRRLCCPPQALQ